MKTVKLFSLFLLTVGTLTFLISHPVFACSCLAHSPVLDEFERSQEVFIGEIIAIEKTDDPNNQYGIKGARVKVQKVFKGDLKQNDELFFDQGGGADCRLTYDEKAVGWKLLIYDSPYDGHRVIITCGRTRGVAGATDDLLYLENMSWAKGKTRISGEFSYGYFREIPSGQSVVGRKIKIIGKKKSFTATTDINGIYEIYDVPPGQYLIEPEIPSGWKLNDYMLERTLEGGSGSLNPGLAQYLESKNRKPNQFLIQVEEGRHVSFDFQFEIDNVIRGRLLAPNGRPIKGTCIHAVPADREPSLYGSTGCTNELGMFEIRELPARKYFLVINGDGEIPGWEPVPMTFYPGVTDRAKATIIDTGEGTKSNLGDFRVPKVLETVRLHGVITYANGNIMRTGKVQFVGDDPKSGFEQKPYDHTSSDGGFELKIIKGQTGRLRAELFTGKKKLETCPEWRKGIIEEDPSANWMVTAVTEWIEIKADKDLTDLRFVFPFNECDQE